MQGDFFLGPLRERDVARLAKADKCFLDLDVAKFDLDGLPIGVTADPQVRAGSRLPSFRNNLLDIAGR